MVREVEPGLLGVDERAFLLHVRAEHLAQRLVHEVRRRVVAHRAAPRVEVDARCDRVADRELAGRHFADMAVDVGLHLLRVLDREQRQAHAALGELAAVADLPAGLGVERRRVEHDDTALSGGERVDLRAVLVERDDAPVLGERLVTAKARLRPLVGERVAHLELRRCTRALALRVHRAIERPPRRCPRPVRAPRPR